MQPFEIPGPLLITPKKISDDRGFFSEVFRQDLFDAGAGRVEFVQQNHSLSYAVGTIRGLHFQRAPRAQGKLVRCVRGAIFDVAVDLRPGSATFGRHVVAEISAENWRQIWIPEGFAHGFCTLMEETEVVYSVTDYYSAKDDAGIAYDDPALRIAWPIDPASAILSAKDRTFPTLAQYSAAEALQPAIPFARV